MTAPSGDHRRAGARHRGRLVGVLAMTLVFMAVEAVTGILTDSLALLSDAGHMATDALGLGMAVAAMVAAGKPAEDGHRTFGTYRLEILAALANAALLFGVAGYVLWEAVRRLQDPPDVLTGPVIVVAAAGLVVNLVGWALLREGSSESLNVEGAYLEVVADMIGSIGVLGAALVVRVTGWPYADPIAGAAIGLFILPRAWRLGGRALRILIQAAPLHLDLSALRRELEGLPGVVDVHDLHVWTLTSEMEVASVHLMTTVDTDPHSVLDRARAVLHDRFGIEHATLQVEPDTHEGCFEISW